MTTEENSWLRSVKEKLRGRKKRLQDHHLHDHDDHDDEEEDGYGHRRHGHAVYWVLRQLWEVRPQAYEPLVIALGPYRKSRKQEPSPTEAHLSISAASLLFAHILQDNDDDDHDDTSFHNLTARIVGHDVNHILNHYVERPPSYAKEEVRTLFPLDSAFLTGFLLHFGCTFSAAANTNTQQELSKRIAAELKLSRRLNDRIIRNLFLMENQIPLDLLKKVLNVSCLESNAPHEFSMCILSIISHANPFQVESGGHIDQRVYRFSIRDRKHLLDCLCSPYAPLGKQYTTRREVQDKS